MIEAVVETNRALLRFVTERSLVFELHTSAHRFGFEIAQAHTDWLKTTQHEQGVLLV